MSNNPNEQFSMRFYFSDADTTPTPKSEKGFDVLPVIASLISLIIALLSVFYYVNGNSDDVRYRKRRRIIRYTLLSFSFILEIAGALMVTIICQSSSLLYDADRNCENAGYWFPNGQNLLSESEFDVRFKDCNAYFISEVDRTGFYSKIEFTEIPRIVNNQNFIYGSLSAERGGWIPSDLTAENCLSLIFSSEGSEIKIAYFIISILYARILSVKIILDVMNKSSWKSTVVDLMIGVFLLPISMLKPVQIDALGCENVLSSTFPLSFVSVNTTILIVLLALPFLIWALALFLAIYSFVCSGESASEHEPMLCTEIAARLYEILQFYWEVITYPIFPDFDAESVELDFLTGLHFLADPIRSFLIVYVFIGCFIYILSQIVFGVLFITGFYDFPLIVPGWYFELTLPDTSIGIQVVFSIFMIQTGKFVRIITNLIGYIAGIIRDKNLLGQVHPEERDIEQINPEEPTR